MKIQDIDLKILSSALREDDLPGTGLGEEDPPGAVHDEDDHPGDVLGRDCLLEVSWMEMTSVLSLMKQELCLMKMASMEKMTSLELHLMNNTSLELYLVKITSLTTWRR